MAQKQRLNETAAMLLIGDGVLATIRPSAHCRVWRAGDGTWTAMTEWLAAHPALVRGLGVIELAAGLWLARRQYDGAGAFE